MEHNNLKRFDVGSSNGYFDINELLGGGYEVIFRGKTYAEIKDTVPEKVGNYKTFTDACDATGNFTPKPTEPVEEVTTDELIRKIWETLPLITLDEMGVTAEVKAHLSGLRAKVKKYTDMVIELRSEVERLKARIAELEAEKDLYKLLENEESINRELRDRIAELEAEVGHLNNEVDFQKTIRLSQGTTIHNLNNELSELKAKLKELAI